MNPSTAAARAVVEALVAHGVREVVLCPGSRSAPLAYALQRADVAGALRLHVRHDERAAAFTALGLALGADAGPAAVVTTSGTAVANLHPAVLEAHEAGVPLLVLTADRPHRMRGTWANQTTALQARVFGGATRLVADLPVVTGDDDVRAWRAAVEEAVSASRGVGPAGRPGPVHLDLAFDDPLVPDDVQAADAIDAGRAASGPVGAVPADSAPVRAPGRDGALAAGPRTVVVAGAGAGAVAGRIAAEAGAPLLAEPSSGARYGPNAVGPYRLLLERPGLGASVERAVVLGRPTLSRPVARLLARKDVQVVHVVRHPDEPGPPGPPGGALGRGGADRAGFERVRVETVRAERDPDASWLAAWQSAGAAAAEALGGVLDSVDAVTGPLLAREVAAATGALDVLVAAASNAVRDLDLAAAVWDSPRRVLANRGLSGIDGTLSTASGAALGAGALTRVLVGDLAFLHDLNGLLLGPEEPEPHLQAVVLNDDGGGIFGLLEHGDPRHAPVFERLFGTPHGADLAALCAGLRVPHRTAADLPSLRAALADPPPGRSVLEVAADRSALRGLHDRIRDAVSLAVAPAPT